MVKRIFPICILIYILFVTSGTIRLPGMGEDKGLREHVEQVQESDVIDESRKASHAKKPWIGESLWDMEFPATDYDYSPWSWSLPDLHLNPINLDGPRDFTFPEQVIASESYMTGCALCGPKVWYDCPDTVKLHFGILHGMVVKMELVGHPVKKYRCTVANSPGGAKTELSITPYANMESGSTTTLRVWTKKLLNDERTFDGYCEHTIQWECEACECPTPTYKTCITEAIPRLYPEDEGFWVAITPTCSRRVSCGYEIQTNSTKSIAAYGSNGTVACPPFYWLMDSTEVWFVTSSGTGQSKSWVTYEDYEQVHVKATASAEGCAIITIVDGCGQSYETSFRVTDSGQWLLMKGSYYPDTRGSIPVTGNCDNCWGMGDGQCCGYAEEEGVYHAGVGNPWKELKTGICGCKHQRVRYERTRTCKRDWAWPDCSCTTCCPEFDWCSAGDGGCCSCLTPEEGYENWEPYCAADDPWYMCNDQTWAHYYFWSDN